MAMRGRHESLSSARDLNFTVWWLNRAVEEVVETPKMVNLLP